jgi:tRNA-dihydrouridine synthase B
VQIAGTDAPMMAEAARLQHRARRPDHRHQHGLPGQEGVQQMGRQRADAGRGAGAEIIEAVVAACAPHGVPVTLKMRTGWCPQHKNAPALARAAEGAGVQMLTVHGRTREQGYRGEAEYDTIAAVKAALKVPWWPMATSPRPKRRAPCWPPPAPTRS